MFLLFSCPIFLGHPISERPLLPKRVAALWEGPVSFGRNRESRSREAAGRRNLARAVPRKMRGKKDYLPKSVGIGIRSSVGEPYPFLRFIWSLKAATSSLE